MISNLLRKCQHRQTANTLFSTESKMKKKTKTRAILIYTQSRKMTNSAC